MNAQKLLLLLGAAGTLLAVPGCVAVLAGGAAGAATYAYVTGACERTYCQPVEVTAQAVHQSLTEYGLSPHLVKQDKFGAVVEAKTAMGKQVSIRVTPEGTGSTVQVRVGHFGDEEISGPILSSLDQRLTPALIGAAADHRQ